MRTPVPGRIVAFGEVMWRLSPPGRELLLQTPRLECWLAGAEANVAVALARLGHDSSLVSALPANRLGDAALTSLRGHGVDCAGVQFLPGRMGIYFVVAGTLVRQGEALYDRANSAFSTASPASWDWPALLKGASRLHLSGITLALGEGPAEAALTAARTAQALNVPVSFDGNFRQQLWDARGVDPAPILRTLVEYADVLFGNDRDIALMLGREFHGDNEACRAAATEAAFAAFPSLRLIASTVREIVEVNHHLLSALVDTRDDSIALGPVRLNGIVDRVGTGDAFVAGVLHGLMRGDPDHGAATGLRLGTLKHSIPGDLSLFNSRDLDEAEYGRDIRR